MLRVKGEREPSHLNGIDVEHRRLPSPDDLDAKDIPPSDVIIATWWETAEQLAKVDAHCETKVYFLQHLETHESQPAARVKATWRLPMQKIVVARWLADLARDEFGDASAITVPNAVDLHQFSVPQRGKQAKPTVGLMYSNTRFKGCDICIEAIEKARRVIPELRIVAFGMAEFPAETRNLPRDTTYTQLPPQDRLKDIYASCDAWLFGSRSEGFGLPLLEAMACRTPVIATPAGAAPELVGQGGGMLVKAEDAEDMAEAIVRLARMPEGEWKRLSDRALEIAVSYSWEHATDLFEAALRKAVAESKRAAAT
jgi:glycosyltransferase involved in cell wall biosynthesis